MRFEQYDRGMAAEVASLIEEAFSSHRKLFPLNLIQIPVPFATADELADTLRGDTVIEEASFVATGSDCIVSAAIATLDGDDAGWWRIVTSEDHRRAGLASECMRLGQAALAEAGRTGITTNAVVDSRWSDAEGLLEASGYDLADPQERNITMVAREWELGEPQIADGYRIDVLTEGDVEEWMEVRNEIFGGEWEPGRFMEYFGNRPDFDWPGWFVVRCAGRIVGMTGALAIEQERAPSTLRGGQIEWVGVLDEHRGAGLGEALMIEGMNYLAKRGAIPALLLTQPFRVPAIRMYEKLGFSTEAAWHVWTKPLA